MKYLVLLIVGLVLVSSEVSALPISMSNLSLFPSTITSNVEGTLESNETMYYLLEASNYTVVATNQLGNGLRVDILPPTVNTTYSSTTLNSTANSEYYIPVGTVVNSYFIQFDKRDVTNRNTSTILSASLSFAANEGILGIMTSTTSHNFSDEFVGVSGFDYAASQNPSLSSRLENNGDSLEWILSPDGNGTTTLNLTFTVANNEIDAVRVITAGGAAPVPEPATMLLLGTSLMGLAGFGRRRLFKRR